MKTLEYIDNWRNGAYVPTCIGVIKFYLV